MTIETRGTIDLKDIKAFELECPNCHAKVVMPIENNLRVPTTCQSCNVDWLIHHSNDHQKLYEFLSLMRQYVKAETQSFILRLEITGLSERR